MVQRPILLGVIALMFGSHLIARQMSSQDIGSTAELEQAAEALNGGRIDAAIEMLRLVEARRAPDARVYLYLGQAYGAKREWEEAMHNFESYLSKAPTPDSPSVYRQAAEAHMNLENPERAISLLERALATGDADGQLHYLLGSAFQHTGNHPDAKSHLERAIELGVDDAPDAYFQLGQMSFYDQDWPRASRVLEQYVGLIPDSPHTAESRYMLAAMAWQSAAAGIDPETNYETARSHIESYLQMPPSPVEPDAYYMLGVLEFQSGNTVEAKRRLEEFLASSPNDDRAEEVRTFLTKLNFTQPAQTESVSLKPFLPLRDSTAEKIILALRDVHQSVGPGFRPDIYAEAIVVGLNRWNITVKRAEETSVYHLGREIGVHILDLVVAGQIIVEILRQPVEELDRARARSYLRHSGKRQAILVYFGAPELEFEAVSKRVAR